MLPGRSRITTRSVDTVLKEGQTSFAPHLTLRFQRAAQTTVGFVVPHSLGLSATSRNRLRRRGYAIIRPLLPNTPSHTLLFFFKKGAEHLSSTEIKTEIKTLLDKLSASRYNTH
jgi:ribonuclease P protein component